MRRYLPEALFLLFMSSLGLWAFWDFINKPFDYYGLQGPIVVDVPRRGALESGPGVVSSVPAPAWLRLEPKLIQVGPLVDGGWHCYDVRRSDAGMWIQDAANGPRPCK